MAREAGEARRVSSVTLSAIWTSHDLETDHPRIATDWGWRRAGRFLYIAKGGAARFLGAEGRRQGSKVPGGGAARYLEAGSGAARYLETGDGAVRYLEAEAGGGQQGSWRLEAGQQGSWGLEAGQQGSWGLDEGQQGSWGLEARQQGTWGYTIFDQLLGQFLGIFLNFPNL